MLMLLVPHPEKHRQNCRQLPPPKNTLASASLAKSPRAAFNAWRMVSSVVLPSRFVNRACMEPRWLEAWRHQWTWTWTWTWVAHE
eukprot:13000719-Alexandrium_andersonii.AAC.1